ncbi:MAG: 3-oxoacyl-[acyl-carrier-protein] synthase III C-terminal domain-containing protein [Pirellulales bacterium]
MLIESLGAYYPARVVSTADILAGCRQEVSVPLERVTGIQRRRIAADDQYSHELAANAVRDCLSRSKYAAHEIDVVISCDISKCSGPNSQSLVEPTGAMRLVKEFGFTGAMAFDVRNACAGVFTALVVAQSLLETGAVRRVLVVSGEHITHLIRTAQLEIDGPRDPRMACLTLGDAGVAALLESGPEDGAGFHDIQLYTLGCYSSLCVGKLSDQPHGGAIMLTDSLKIAEVGIEQIATHTPRFLQNCGVRPEACDQFIMHQTSTQALQRAASELNRSLGRKVLNGRNMINNLAERGNTATTSHFVAVMDQIVNGTIRSNNKVVFGISASGQTAGTALYTFDDLPDRIRDNTKPLAPNRSPANARRHCLGDDAPRVRIESFEVVPVGQRPQRNTLAQLTQAAESCFANSFYDPPDIDLLINAGVYRNEFLSEPALAAVLAGELHINDASESPDDKKSLAFDVASGATGFLQACYLASQMISSETFGTAMVVASEIEYNRDVWPENLLDLEETASAAILDGRGNGEVGFGRFYFCNDWDHLDRFESHSVYRNGRSALSFARDDGLEDYYLQSIRRAVRELLDETGHRISDFDVVLPPQISPSFVARLGEKLAVSDECLIHLPRPHKHLYTSSLAHSFDTLRNARRITPGMKGLIIEVGAGIQVACATYRW